MKTTGNKINFDLLLKLRLLIARFGEMDCAGWWNTGDAARRTSLLGRSGSVLMSRGFPRTHLFAQARLVFEVARARCSEVFDPPGCVTLWRLPAEVEDQFDARWAHWLETRDAWSSFFKEIEQSPNCLIEFARMRGMAKDSEIDVVSTLRRSAEGRAVPLSGTNELSDSLLVLLALGFSRGETGKLAVPYARTAG